MDSNNKVVVTVSVTGSMGDKETPYIPIAPREIAESAMEARKGRGSSGPYPCSRS